MSKKLKQIKSTKEKILKELANSDSFIAIINEDDGNKVLYCEHNMCAAEVIAACEVVKYKFIRKCWVK